MKYSLKTLLLLLFAFSSFSLSAQGRMVSGTVTSAEGGEPLIGVNITVKGALAGTISDFNGEYKVEVNEGATLVFSYVGYAIQEFKVRGQTIIDVQLYEGERLEELVVTALGITRQKKALGYAVDQVGKDALSASAQTNLLSSLQGRVPGVIIQNSSGAPGAGADILIRGVSSLDPNRSNRPLYVIDGVEISDDNDVLPISPSAGSNADASSAQTSVSNRAIDLNPEDIESISVLKGAAATSLYGIRAANGAIIISTKKGTSGKSQIDLHYGTGWENVLKTPTVQRKFIDGHRTSTAITSWVFYNWGSKVQDSEVDPTRDIYQEFFQTGSTQNFGASVTAGNDVFTYRVSADRHDQKGIIPNSDFTILTFS